MKRKHLFINAAIAALLGANLSAHAQLLGGGARGGFGGTFGGALGAGPSAVRGNAAGDASGAADGRIHGPERAERLDRTTHADARKGVGGAAAAGAQTSQTARQDSERVRALGITQAREADSVGTRASEATAASAAKRPHGVSDGPGKEPSAQPRPDAEGKAGGGARHDTPSAAAPRAVNVSGGANGSGSASASGGASSSGGANASGGATAATGADASMSASAAH
jgi:hypothetical protein